MLRLLPAENWDYRISDVFRGLAVLAGNGKDVDMLEISELGTCVPTRSARAAIVAAVQGLELPAGSRIGVSLYCCPAVFKAIREAGCIPRFLDVEYDTYCLSPEDLSAKISEIDAVIAVHMFGNLCDMSRIQEIAGQKPVIEDCAQSLGSRLGGRMAGSFGDIAAFSFRSGKYLSVGEGGALYAADPALLSRLLRIVKDMPTPGCSDELMHIAKTYIRTKLRNPPLYGMVGKMLWKAYSRTVDFADQTPIVMGRIFRTDLVTINARLKSLDVVIAKQRDCADYFSATLEMDEEMLCREKPGTYLNRYLYPILFPEPEQRERMADFLHKKSVGTIKPYSDIAQKAGKHFGYAGDCPVSEEIARRVLVIPSSWRVGAAKRNYIAGCVNDAWRRIRR